jgi:hypothetical protein
VCVLLASLPLLFDLCYTTVIRQRSVIAIYLKGGKIMAASPAEEHLKVVFVWYECRTVLCGVAGASILHTLASTPA